MTDHTLAMAVRSAHDRYLTSLDPYELADTIGELLAADDDAAVVGVLAARGLAAAE